MTSKPAEGSKMLGKIRELRTKIEAMTPAEVVAFIEANKIPKKAADTYAFIERALMANSKPAAKLKPKNCPFCASNKISTGQHYIDLYWVVSCDNYKCTIQPCTLMAYGTKAEAIAAWNIRRRKVRKK